MVRFSPPARAASCGTIRIPGRPAGWFSEIDGKPINGINEMIPDGTGGIYFGTVDIEQIEKGKPTRPAALYRLTANRRVILVADGLRLRQPASC